ncbi:PD-(D/E)XK nuclease family protein [Candidatus Woesearchaeota archaeon]|nr:MAG: PD-(D/E)XK nuclease family protein [Candidatus Woesearchaeota archaeon]
MPTYSHSKINTFEQCSLKYKFRYIDRIPVEGGPGIEAFMGSMVHEALEELYEQVLNGKIPSEEEVVTRYKELWEEHKEGEEELVIVKEGMSEDDYKNLGEEMLRNYYRRHYPFNDSKTIGLETQELLDLDGSRKYHIRIDRFAKKEDGTYEVHDYKTGGRLPRQEDIDQDTQLAMYSIWVREKYPDAKRVRLIWHYLKFEEDLETQKSPEELEKIKEEILEKIKKIEQAESFEPNVSALCNWCEYQEICPAWKHKFKQEEEEPEEEALNGKQLVDEYVEAKEEYDKLKDKLVELKKKIADYARKEGVTTVFGSRAKANVKETARYSWPPKNTEEREELKLALKEIQLYDKASDIDTTELTHLLEELPEEQAERIKEFAKLVKSVRVTFSKNTD